MFSSMFRRVYKSVGLFLLAIGFSASLAAHEDSGASWNLLLKANIDDRWFVISRSNMASRNNFEDNFFGFTGAAIGYQLTKQWSLRAGYRHVWLDIGGDWFEEDRPFAEAYFADKWNDFRVTNRSRVEFRFFDHRDDDVRLRNEITVEAPWELTPLKLRPFLEEEVFYSLDSQRIETNWLGGGLSWRPRKGMKLKAGYRWNHFRVGDRWRDRDVLVLGMNLFF